MSKKKLRKLLAEREMHKRKWRRCRNRLIAYGIIIVLELLYGMYNYYWGLPNAGKIGLICQMVYTSLAALFVFLWLLGFRDLGYLGYHENYEERKKTLDEETFKRKERIRIYLFPLALAPAFGVACFMFCTMGVPRYIKDWIEGPRTAVLTLEDISFVHIRGHARGRYAGLIPQMPAGQFVLFFKKDSTDDGGMFRTSVFFDFSQCEIDKVDQLLRGVKVRGKPFSAASIAKPSCNVYRSTDGYYDPDSGRYFADQFLVTYYPRSSTFVSGKLIRGKR